MDQEERAEQEQADFLQLGLEENRDFCTLFGQETRQKQILYP